MYLTILITHTTLAVVIVPLVLITLSRALRERFAAHRAIARWTLPLWLYVSVTGVIVYWLLYIAYTPIWPAGFKSSKDASSDRATCKDPKALYL